MKEHTLSKNSFFDLYFCVMSNLGSLSFSLPTVLFNLNKNIRFI